MATEEDIKFLAEQGAELVSEGRLLMKYMGDLMKRCEIYVTRCEQIGDRLAKSQDNKLSQSLPYGFEIKTKQICRGSGIPDSPSNLDSGKLTTSVNRDIDMERGMENLARSMIQSNISTSSSSSMSKSNLSILSESQLEKSVLGPSSNTDSSTMTIKSISSSVPTESELENFIKVTDLTGNFIEVNVGHLLDATYEELYEVIADEFIIKFQDNKRYDYENMGIVLNGKILEHEDKSKRITDECVSEILTTRKLYIIKHKFCKPKTCSIKKIVV